MPSEPAAPRGTAPSCLSTRTRRRSWQLPQGLMESLWFSFSTQMELGG